MQVQAASADWAWVALLGGLAGGLAAAALAGLLRRRRPATGAVGPTADGAAFRGRTLKSYFWDGVTDYAKPAPGDEAKVEAEEKERIDGFGDWLEDQGDLPPELQLRVEA